MSSNNGRVAELVYAQVSEACVCKDLRVRVPPRPPFDYILPLRYVVECPERRLGVEGQYSPIAPFDYRSGSPRPIEDSWSSTTIFPSYLSSPK